MKKFCLILTSSLIMFGCNQQMKYPDTKKQDVSDIYFGDTIADPYRWLENDTAQDVKEWVIAENAVTNKYFEKIPFRQALNQRLTKLWNFPKYGTPFKKGDRYFYMYNSGLQNQYVLYTQKSLTEEAEILLDPNHFSEDGTVALSGMSISNDGKYLAYQLSSGGSDWSEICVMNIETKELLPDHIQWVKFSDVSWYQNGFYYSAYDAPKESDVLKGKNEFHKVYFHQLGTDQSQDVLVYQDPEHPLRNFGIGVTEDEKFMFLTGTESTSGNFLYVKETGNDKAAFMPIYDQFEADFSPIDNVNDQIYILTNYKAPKYRVVAVDPKKPQEENWKEIIPENENVLEWATIAGGKLVTTYMQDAHNVVFINDLEGNKLFELSLPTVGSVGGFSGNKESNEVFYSFASYTFPNTIYKYDLSNNQSEIFRKLDVDFDPEAYETNQVFFESKDGTKVPMFITNKKGLALDGQNPTLLYGYGGFNISMTPGFSMGNIPFLENGGIFVVVNLRGGGEYGKEWHKAGTKLQKQNVFDDFIGAAEWLIANNYTSSEKLAIRGGSNGGLLVGACMTQRPDLFKVAIPQVGVMDMLRYHKFTIGWAWAEDYGTSEDNAEMFQYLKNYSPVHNLKAGVAYPATLVTTADHDDRVVPAHSFKFIAGLQAVQTGDNPTLIRIETRAGHGAGKPTTMAIEEMTDIWSFVMYNLGMNPKF
ncbi:MAG: prolyl oligopeptidase family serine peptidase [Bacteroidales bacterium]|nr:prolyl oligopeptidase family serine peptidase [Bacteroidales bacterium]